MSIFYTPKKKKKATLFSPKKKKKIDIPKIMHPLINPLDEIRVLLMDNVMEWVKENQIFNYYWFSSKVL